MKEHDNVEIDWGVVEVSVEIVILGDTEAGWTETARKLAEDVEEWTGKIPSRWGRYMIWFFLLPIHSSEKRGLRSTKMSIQTQICYVYVKRKPM